MSAKTPRRSIAIGFLALALLLAPLAATAQTPGNAATMDDVYALIAQAAEPACGDPACRGGRQEATATSASDPETDPDAEEDDGEEGDSEDEEPEDTRARFEIPVEGGRAVLLAQMVNFRPGEFVVAEDEVEVR